MSKAETIEALMESATQVFSETGYDGASLRDIAAGAKTPLSTINMYFGTKADLFVAVIANLAAVVEEDRWRTLAERVAAKGGGPAELRDLVFALVAPIVTRARSARAEDRRIPRMLRHWVGAPTDVKAAMRRGKHSDSALARWIEGLMTACPELSEAEAVWGFSFVVGALYSWELMDNRYDGIVEMEDADPATVIDYLVEFCVGGMEKLQARARNDPLRPGAARG